MVIDLHKKVKSKTFGFFNPLICIVLSGNFLKLFLSILLRKNQLRKMG